MVAVVYLMTRASAMVWDGCVALLLLLVAALGLGQRPHPEPGLRGLRHSSDCGIKGMQLLVFPRPGQTVRFKVVGERGRTRVPTFRAAGRGEAPRPPLCHHTGEGEEEGGR